MIPTGPYLSQIRPPPRVHALSLHPKATAGLALVSDMDDRGKRLE